VRDEHGFTLVELIASLGVGLVVLFACWAMLDGSRDLSDKTRARVDNLQRGRLGMELITQQLRSQTCLGPGFPAITVGENARIVFYGDLGTEGPGGTPPAPPFAPTKRELRLTGTSIVETVWRGSGTPPNVTYPAQPWRTRTLVSDVQAVPGVPLFRYFAFQGTNPATPDLVQTAPLNPEPHSTASNAAARTVKIAVAYEVLPSRSQFTRTRTRFENFVYVRTSDPTDPEHSPQCL
jgi:hypothetical protein